MPKAAGPESPTIRYDNANGFPDGIIYRNGQPHHDPAHQEIRYRDGSHAKEDLAAVFPFDPHSDPVTEFGYKYGLFTLGFAKDGPFNLEDEGEVARAKRGCVYAIAATVAKDFDVALSEDKIPDPESAAFRALKEGFYGKESSHFLSSLIAALLVNESVSLQEQLDVYKIAKTIRIIKENGLSEIEAAAEVERLEKEARQKLLGLGPTA